MTGLFTNTIAEATSGSGITFSNDIIPATPLSHRNAIINGNFDVWQRGTTFNNSASTYHYSADRWKYYNYQQGSTTTVTRQAFTLGQTDVPNEPAYYLRHTLGSSNQEWLLENRIEDVRTFAGQNVTVSLWMKSSSAQTVRLRFTQHFGTGGSPSSLAHGSTQDCSVTTSWQKFTKTFAIPSISSKTIGSDGAHTSWLGCIIGSLGATAVSSSTIDIAQVQVEKGSVATPFEYRSYGDELTRCLRYFQNFGSANEGDQMGWMGMSYGANSCYMPVPFYQPMRAQPEVLSDGTWSTRAQDDRQFTADFGIQRIGKYGCVLVQGNSSLPTQEANTAFWVEMYATDSELQFDAEL